MSDYVVKLENAAIYHADASFGRRSEAKQLREGEMVLSEVSFTVAEGEFVYLLGRVGSGKSTLLNRLLNEDRAMVSEIAKSGLCSCKARICVFFYFVCSSQNATASFSQPSASVPRPVEIECGALSYTWLT